MVAYVVVSKMHGHTNIKLIITHFSHSIHTVKENAEALVAATREIGL